MTSFSAPAHASWLVRCRRQVKVAIAAPALTVLGLGVAAPAGAAHAQQPNAIYRDPSPRQVVKYIHRNARTPYQGWTSWTLQTSKRPELNPRGPYSWMTEENILQQARAMARELKPHGYRYINIDAGWGRKWDGTPKYDEYGRPAVDAERFPHGLAYVARMIHAR